MAAGAVTYLAFRDSFVGLLDPRFYTAEWLDQEVASGRIRCLASSDAAILVSVKTYPTGAKELHFMAAAGDVRALVNDLAPQAEAWGRKQGCIVAVIESREGWQRIMKSSGYGLYQVGLRKEL